MFYVKSNSLRLFKVLVLNRQRYCQLLWCLLISKQGEQKQRYLGVLHRLCNCRVQSLCPFQGLGDYLIWHFPSQRAEDSLWKIISLSFPCPQNILREFALHLILDQKGFNGPLLLEDTVTQMRGTEFSFPCSLIEAEARHLDAFEAWFCHQSNGNNVERNVLSNDNQKRSWCESPKIIYWALNVCHVTYQGLEMQWSSKDRYSHFSYGFTWVFWKVRYSLVLGLLSKIKCGKLDIQF